MGNIYTSKQISGMTASNIQQQAIARPKFVRFSRDKDQTFSQTLNARVNAYFESKNLSKHADGAMIFKIVFYIGGLVTLYAALLFAGVTDLWLSWLLWVGLGLFAALTAVNVCHDAIHGALTDNKFLTTVFSKLFNVLGANDYMWNIMHNVVHHTYTNIPGHDEDINLVAVIRLSPDQKRYKMHRFQHIYAFALYGLSSLSWVFSKDYVKYFQSKIGSYPNNQHPRGTFLKILAWKMVYYTLFLVLPMVLLPFAWWQILIGFLLMHYAEGMTLALIFMLAHAVEETAFPIPDDEGQIDDAWAVHQLQTTMNFCQTNPFANFVCGGLNFQIEHHLFSRVCHTHYKHIAPIVKETALEFGHPYLEQPTFSGALGAHYRYLKQMGRED